MKAKAWGGTIEFSAEEILDDILEESQIASANTTSVTLGRMLAFTPSTGALIDFPANLSGVLLPARSTVPVTKDDVGQEVALAFEEGDPAKPIILGVLQKPSLSGPEPQESFAQAEAVQVALDDDTLLLSAKNEIVLRCGRSSITLTSAGKVLIRGDYLLSRSSGANRIKGGSVQIN